MNQKGEIIVGLDVGTTKVSVLVGEHKDDGHIEIIGLGSHPSKGMKSGVITEIEATVETIRKAVMEAELMAGVQISNVYVGISGSHILGFNSHGMAAVKGKEILRADVDRTTEQAKAVVIPADRQVLHTLVQEFIVDNQDGIRMPVGMSGVRLEAKVHIVTGSISAVSNMIRCCNKAGLSVADIVIEPMASALAALSDDEKELGVALADIGGGTVDLVIYLKGSVVHTSVLPMGGDFITQDIAVGLHTPMQAAERAKREFGCAVAGMVEKNESIPVSKVGSGDPKEVSRQALCDIIEARVEEILNAVHKEIRKTNLEERLGAGLVLTGGTANLLYISQFAEELMGLPVRVGAPSGVTGLVDIVRDPAYATGVGLLMYAAQHGPSLQGGGRPMLRKAMDRLRLWFQDFV